MPSLPRLLLYKSAPKPDTSTPAPSLASPPALSTTAQPCALTFYLTNTPQRPKRVVFTGLTADEKTSNGNIGTGFRLTCACANTSGLSPLRWMGPNEMELPNNNKTQLVDYREAGNQQGSAVNLRINSASFSCAEAGTYTCIVGNSNRTALVTPVGECSKQCGLETHSNTGHHCLHICSMNGTLRAYLHWPDCVLRFTLADSQARSVVPPMLLLQPTPLVQFAVRQTSPCTAQQTTQLGQVSHTSGSRMAP